MLAALDFDPSLEIDLLSADLLEPMEMDIATDGRVFIAERGGKVKLHTPGQAGMQVLLDLKSDTRCEGGLMGLEFSPDFDQTGWIFLYHSVKDPRDADYNIHQLRRA